MNIQAFLKKLGTFQNTSLFNNLAIHAWFGYGVIFTLGTWWPTHRLLQCALAALVAAAKEFIFDARYETPPQPFLNGAGDFAGYVLGGVLAMLLLLA